MCLKASQDSQIGSTYLNLDLEHHRRLKDDEKNKDPAERMDSLRDAHNKADEATISIIVIAKKCKDSEKLKELTFLI